MTSPPCNWHLRRNSNDPLTDTAPYAIAPLAWPPEPSSCESCRNCPSRMPPPSTVVSWSESGVVVFEGQRCATGGIATASSHARDWQRLRIGCDCHLRKDSSCLSTPIVPRRIITVARRRFPSRTLSSTRPSRHVRRKRSPMLCERRQTPTRVAQTRSGSTLPVSVA